MPADEKPKPENKVPQSLKPSPISGYTPPVEYRFEPGVSGNPGGRPIYKPITAAYRKLGELDPVDLEKYEPKTVWELRAKVMHMNETVRAAREIADRVEGRATETIEHRGVVGSLIAEAARLARDETEKSE